MTGLQSRLLAWWDNGDGRRDLPWRRTRDPWAVLVSELMLQQTQVARVVPRFETFLERFASPSACAAAPLGEVVRAWSGLGYNRRAVHLHRAARTCEEHHAGCLPDTLDDLLALPGIGPYTARAVLAFAYEEDHGVVDVNAARVLARAVAGRRLDGRGVQAVADASVPPGRAWVWNQAVLDVGAGWCRNTPRCDSCPLVDVCRWHAQGGPDPALGSAGTGAIQGRFAGSDREGRGRLVAALRHGPLPSAHVAAVLGWPDDPARAGRVVSGLVADGLVVHGADILRLP